MPQLLWPLEHPGSVGEVVRSIQHLLVAHGQTIVVDGDYGPQTQAAVRALQSAHGLVVDGIVGAHTWPVLIIQVHSGSQGHAVRAVQSQLASRGVSGWIAVDGVFGPDTDAAVRWFQRDLGLVVDGIVGLFTWNKLVSGYLTSLGPSDAAHAVYHAWTVNDQGAAEKDATPDAVAQLFAHSWSAAQNWAFDRCDGAAGHVYCVWQRSGGHSLTLAVNDFAGAPFFYVDNATVS